MPIVFLEKRELSKICDALQYYNSKKHIETTGSFNRNTADIEFALRNKLNAM